MIFVKQLAGSAHFWFMLFFTGGGVIYTIWHKKKRGHTHHRLRLAIMVLMFILYILFELNLNHLTKGN